MAGGRRVLDEAAAPKLGSYEKRESDIPVQEKMSDFTISSTGNQ